jgi:hypothetical protein
MARTKGGKIVPLSTLAGHKRSYVSSLGQQAVKLCDERRLLMLSYSFSDTVPSLIHLRARTQRRQRPRAALSERRRRNLHRKCREHRRHSLRPPSPCLPLLAATTHPKTPTCSSTLVETRLRRRLQSPRSLRRSRPRRSSRRSSRSTSLIKRLAKSGRLGAKSMDPGRCWQELADMCSMLLFPSLSRLGRQTALISAFDEVYERKKAVFDAWQVQSYSEVSPASIVSVP